jgi:hypothetical protein
MKNFFTKNNFFVGVFVAIVAPVLFYGVLYVVNMLLVNYGLWNGFDPPENIYLLSVLVNMVLLKTYFVRLKVEKTGQGLLITTIALILLFFYLYFENPK